VTCSSGAVINYSYAADGTKLREAKTVSSTTTLTDYTGNLILENGTRSRLLFDGGYVSMSNSGYHFFITDHLGSVRVVANTGGTAEEYNHYYPLGGPIAQYSSSTSLQPIKFQGKEWSAGKGLDLYDFGARRYDPSTGKWISQDPLSEKYYAHSPYLFCAANPVRFVDPRGRSTQVRRLDDGRFEVIGGNLEDSDLGIYVGELDQDGAWKQTEKDAIGYSATLYSFYNTDEGENHGWQIGAIIDPHDNSGQRFMNRFGSYSNLLVYMLRARTNHSWDFKVTNGVSNNPIDGISIYRGMPITIGGNVVYASARDVGNIVAGYVGGINGLSWESFRFGCDTYQTFYSSLKKGSLSKEVEGMTTTTAQRLGWEKGNFSWGVLNALRK
jgi:RHS repeat-associated protein